MADDIFPAFQKELRAFSVKHFLSKQLIKSLELVALGELVMHRSIRCFSFGVNEEMMTSRSILCFAMR